MKIQCPVCGTAYNFRSERHTKPIVRAACKRCGNTLAIHRNTGEVETTAPSPSPTRKPPAKDIRRPFAGRPPISERAAGRATKDYPARIIVIAALILLAVASYLLVSNLSKGFWARPEKSASQKIKGADRFEVCRSFVRKDKKLLASVGENGRYTLLNEEVMVWKDKETARMTIRVQGSKGSQRLQLLLLKEKGQWRIIAAGEEQKVAKAAPQPRRKKKPSIKASPSHPKERPNKLRLPATTTNKQLADYVRANPDIENLNIQSCRNLTDISPLGSLSRLSILNMPACSKIANISPLANLKNLKQLNLHNCMALVDLTPLIQIDSLRVLHLPPATTNDKLAQVLGHLPQLERVSLKECRLITDISSVASLTNLTHLEMNHGPDLVDISPLAGLTRLKVLSLKNSGVQDLKALAKLSGLEWLYLSNSKRVNDLSPLKNLTNLRILILDDCKGVRDISALRNLTNLTILGLRGLEDISDISALSSLTQLRNLYLQRCKKISQTQIRELNQSLPRCIIDYRDARLGLGVAR